MHGGNATHVDTIHVIEEFEGERAWDVDVHVFDLYDHPSAERAYAWSVVTDPETEARRFYAVLHEGPVDSPEKAVRAAIVQQHREGD